MLKIIVLLVLASTCLTVYKDQFGLFEWRTNHFGSIKEIYKNGANLLVSDDDSFGVIDTNGKYIFSKTINKSDYQMDVQNDRILVFNSNQNVIEVYNPWLNTLEKVFNIDTTGNFFQIYGCRQQKFRSCKIQAHKGDSGFYYQGFFLWIGKRRCDHKKDPEGNRPTVPDLAQPQRCPHILGPIQRNLQEIRWQALPPEIQPRPRALREKMLHCG